MITYFFRYFMSQYNHLMKFYVIFNKAVKLTYQSKPSPVTVSESVWKGIYLKLTSSQISPFEKYWSLSLTQSQEVDDGIKFYTISDRYTSALSGYSVIGFYISIVYLIGKFLRMAVSGDL